MTQSHCVGGRDNAGKVEEVVKIHFQAVLDYWR
jgi:hypothetical protein